MPAAASRTRPTTEGSIDDPSINRIRFIIGCADPTVSLPKAYQTFLAAFDCPILPMRYESAELAKIAINCCLVAMVSTANTLAEVCEGVGADWSEGRLTAATKDGKRRKAAANPRGMQGYAAGR